MILYIHHQVLPNYATKTNVSYDYTLKDSFTANDLSCRRSRLFYVTTHQLLQFVTLHVPTSYMVFLNTVNANDAYTVYNNIQINKLSMEQPLTTTDSLLAVQDV